MVATWLDPPFLQGECIDPHENDGGYSAQVSTTLTPAPWPRFCVIDALGVTKYIFRAARVYLRRNMLDLLHSQSACGRNAPRNFWAWLSKQPWRAMLPPPFECPGLHSLQLMCLNQTVKVYKIVGMLNIYLPRLNVVLEDKSLKEEYTIEPWHLFLPSEV